MTWLWMREWPVYRIVNTRFYTRLFIANDGWDVQHVFVCNAGHAGNSRDNGPRLAWSEYTCVFLN